MIREYRAEDVPHIVDMVSKASTMSARKVKETMEGPEKKAFVWDAGGRPVGCLVAFDSEVHIFVEPDSRGRGIGKALWNHVMTNGAKTVLDCLYATYSEDPATCRFFEGLGFEPWFTLQELKYDGGMFDEPDACMVTYENRFFHDYLETINLCFREMREINHIEPHVIFADEAFDDEGLRKEILARRDRIWVMTDGPGPDSRFMGFVELESPEGGDGNSIDTLAVRPELQRQGLGGKLVRFGLNRLLERGCHPAYIGIIATNTHVRRLYESMGCGFVMGWRHSRLFKKPLDTPGNLS